MLHLWCGRVARAPRLIRVNYTRTDTLIVNRGAIHTRQRAGAGRTRSVERKDHRITGSSTRRRQHRQISHQARAGTGEADFLGTWSGTRTDGDERVDYYTVRQSITVTDAAINEMQRDRVSCN